MNVRVCSNDGQRFDIRKVGLTPWGDERLEFTFELRWANGKIDFVCSRDRLLQLQDSLNKHRTGEHVNHCFINEEGNLEITLTGLNTGLCQFHVIAIPNMMGDDRIEFSFDGVME